MGRYYLIRLLVAEFFAGAGAERAMRTLFVVGDYKQSIFSFQGAAPAEFRKMIRDERKKWTDVAKQANIKVQ